VTDRVAVVARNVLGILSWCFVFIIGLVLGLVIISDRGEGHFVMVRCPESSEQVLWVVLVVRQQMVCLDDVLRVFVLSLYEVVFKLLDECSTSVPVQAQQECDRQAGVSAELFSILDVGGRWHPNDGWILVGQRLLDEYWLFANCSTAVLYHFDAIFELFEIRLACHVLLLHIQVESSFGFM
jgi:hypothetical protein